MQVRCWWGERGEERREVKGRGEVAKWDLLPCDVVSLVNGGETVTERAVFMCF